MSQGRKLPKPKKTWQTVFQTLAQGNCDGFLSWEANLICSSRAGSLDHTTQNTDYTDFRVHRFPCTKGIDFFFFKDNIPHYYTYWWNSLKALYTLRKEKLYCHHHGDPKGRAGGDELLAGGFCGAEQFVKSPQFPFPHLQNSHHRALHNTQFWWFWFFFPLFGYWNYSD